MKYKTIFILISIIVLLSGCIDSKNEVEVIQNTAFSNTDEEPTPTEKAITEFEINLEICEQIAKEYYDTHIYLYNNVYDCDDMACDVWNELKLVGIESTIIAGNLDEDIYNTKDETLLSQIELINHVWILAEIEPGVLFPIECTTGKCIYPTEYNKEVFEQYYCGFYFDNPKNYRRYLVLSSEYLNQANTVDYETYAYDDMVDQYNDMDYYSQKANKQALEVYERHLYEETVEFVKIQSELRTIIEYG